MLTCRQCGLAVDTINSFCPRCGHAVAVRCVSCGAVLPDGAAFCSECGTSVTTITVLDKDRDVSPPSTPAVRSYDRASIMRRVLAGLIDVGIMLALLLPFRKNLLLARSIKLALVPMILPFLYIMFRDVFDGRSVGKRLAGLMVVNCETGQPGGISDSVVRNWFLAIVLVLVKKWWIINYGLVVFFLLASVILVQIVSGRKRRLGDGLARTQVVDLATTVR